MPSNPSFSLKTPCKDCPWRKDKTVAPAEMFPKERYEALQECVKQGLGKPIFACHNSYGKVMKEKTINPPLSDESGVDRNACHNTPEDKPKACAGYLLVEGAVNFGVRIAILQGRLNLDELYCDEELYSCYEEMAEANGVYLGKIER